MELAMIIVLFLLGLVFIVKGGDIFVDAASWFAEVFGIPKFLIGATVVSVATTLPELLTSIFATAKGQLGIAAGNAIGSVTANIALIMAISLVFLPSAVDRKSYTHKTVLMAAACAVLFVFSLSGKLGILPTVILLAIVAYYTYDSIVEAKKSMSEAKDEDKPEKDRRSILINIAKFVLGAAGIVLGADLLVDNGTELARIIGVDEGIIGVTVIAIGTSLPELATAITAIAKKQASLSVGNIIGANIIDLSLILPVCSLISGGKLTVPRPSYAFDLPVCFLVIAIAVVPTIIAGKYRRWQGIALLAVYAVYVYLRCTLNFADPAVLPIFPCYPEV